MELDSLQRLVREGESDTLELKKSLSDIDRIVEEVCGFANTHGGIVLIGVSDDGRILGIEVAAHTLERLANKIADNTEESLSPKVETISLEGGKALVSITVSESMRKPHTAFGRPFRRIGTVTKRMTKEEYDPLVLEKNTERLRWDATACKDTSFKDLSPQAVKPYLSMRERARNVSGKAPMGAEQLLRNIGALTPRGEATNAGMAFFGRKPERHLINVRLRLVRIKGTDRTGLILDKLDCEGVLWRIVDRGEEFIRRNIRLIGYLPQESWRRRDTFDYPVGALREGIINAVIHRDYWQNGEVIVYIFDDHIDIMNPGGFPDGVTPERPEHRPRNPLLSQYMYDIGYIEKYGTGILRIRELCRENGNQLPEYRTDRHFTVLTFRALEPEAASSETMGEPDRGERKLRALSHVRKNGFITRAAYAKLNLTSPVTAYRDLTALVERGSLVAEGRGRATRYVLPR